MEDAPEPRNQHDGTPGWPSEPDPDAWPPPPAYPPPPPYQAPPAYPPPPAHPGGTPWTAGDTQPGWGSTGAGWPAGGWSGGQGGWSAGPPGWSGGGWAGGPGDPANGGWASPWGGGGGSRTRHTLPGAITALLLAVAVLVGLGLGHSVWRSTTSTGVNNGGSFYSPSGGTGGSGTGSGGPSDVNAIAAKVAPALVDIDTDLSYEGGQAAGTGIVLTPTGLILTNNHVIAEATSITVTDIGNGRSYTGEVVGYDHTHDIALVQLKDAHNLTTATIGNSAKVSVGDEIVGLGNAGGIGGDPTAAGGAVTALGQSITASDEADGTSEQLAGLIEVNADIEPGDSGGALINAHDQVIGVDTAASAGFSFQSAGGQGFAIPINQAVGIVDQIEAGRATGAIHIGPTAFLGVLVSQSTGGSGATLASTVPGGPAARAGLVKGDTITSLAGQTVSSPSALTDLILRYHPGDQVEIVWTDASGQSHQAKVTLVTGPAQ